MSGGDQMMLWPDLPVPAAAPTPPRAPRRRRPRPKAVQLAFVFGLRRLRREAPPVTEDDEDAFYVEFCRTPVHQRIAAASAQVPPEARHAPRSVWDLAVGVTGQLEGLLPSSGAAPAAPAPKRPRVVASAGVLRVMGAQYPANRWDEERIEQERIRRAKQRPPRPTKKAKTRSAKLRELIGEPHDE